MTINYELREEDYIKFNLYHVEESPSQIKMYWVLRVLAPLLGAVAMYAIGTSLFNQPSIFWSIIAIGFFVGWIIYYPKEHKKIIANQTKKLLSEGDNSSLFGKQTMTIEDNVITVTSENGNQELKLDTIKIIKQSEDLIMLYNSSVSAIIIPTRDLTSDEMLQLTDLKTQINNVGNE